MAETDISGNESQGRLRRRIRTAERMGYLVLIVLLVTSVNASTFVSRSLPGTAIVSENHDVGVTNVKSVTTFVSQGGIVPITVTVQNKGNLPESFGVTVFLNDTAIGPQTVSELAPGAARTLSFSWDTAGVTLAAFFSRFLITANASLVPGEADAVDNVLVDGILTVVPPVDLKRFFELDWADHDNDGKVTIIDAAHAALVFDQPNDYWDLSLTNKTDIVDMATLAFYFDQPLGQESFPGRERPPGTMDTGWIAGCSTLPEPLQTYCTTRIR